MVKFKELRQSWLLLPCRAQLHLGCYAWVTAPTFAAGFVSGWREPVMVGVKLPSGRCLTTKAFLSFSVGYSKKCQEITAAVSASGKPAKNNGPHQSPVQACGKQWISNWRKGTWKR